MNHQTQLSELVVTKEGYLKDALPASCQTSQWAAIIGIHIWSDKVYSQVWRSLRAMSWMLINEDF